MQAYFDRDDAELERKCIVSRTASKADVVGGVLKVALDRRNIVTATLTLAGLVLVSFLLAVYLGSLPLKSQIVSEARPEFTSKFIIELPRPAPPKPKIKAKPFIKPPENKPIERFRSIPDRTTRVLQPKAQPRGRNEVRDAQRVAQQEASTTRSLPGTIAPVVAPTDEFVQRDLAQEQSERSTSSVIRSNGNREPVGEVAARNTRAVAETGVSRIKLDPYHYQMVNICLRQCVRSMFVHTGLDEQERVDSKDWLKVTRDADNHFDFRYGGRWVRLHVNVNLLGDISNIDFVRIPGDMGDAESLLEDATRKLCRLLRYDDCFAKL